MRKNLFVGFAILTLAGLSETNAAPPVEDVPFVQEYHEAFALGDGAANDVRAIAADKSNAVWAATKTGLYVLRNGEAWKRWADIPQEPLFDLWIDDAGSLWVGAWNGLYRIADQKTEKIAAVDGPVAVIGPAPGGAIALGPDGAWQAEDGTWSRREARWSRNVKDVAVTPEGDLWVATGMGLYRENHSGLQHYSRTDQLFSGEVKALAVAPDGRLWIGSLGGIDAYENGTRVETRTARDGLPNYDVRSLTFAPDGRLWAGTALGVVRYDGESWSLRHGRRWLLNDNVRDVAFDSEGTAWIATAAGVSAIKNRTMTLAEKADFYLDICRKRHIRPPGFVEKCRFLDPKDKSVFLPIDDDNDGSYTGNYLVMESFRYAVTQNPKAKSNADEIFDALEMLQTVTGTEGFLARTMIPSSWKHMADPNQKLTEAEVVERHIGDPRWKYVPDRWRLSADGKWLWKGDTSSDEITGNMYAYYYYYTLAADEAHKQRVRRLVQKVMDHIIDGGYLLRDIDGEPTRWGVWSPEKLLGDPDWRVERRINALEMLSFLKVAHRITGDAKYQTEYEKLIDGHGYAEIARRPKAYGRSERSHIDDELMAFAVPGLLLSEKDPKLHGIYMEGYTWAYRTVENDVNPLFNFTFGLVGGENFHLKESVAFLRDTPLDLVHWTIDSSKREDVHVARRPMLESLQTDRMLPPSERGVMRWDKNPWEVISGDFGDAQGSRESNGVFWLLPYWMGRYYGFIDAPK